MELRVGLTRKMMFKQRLEGEDRVIPGDNWRSVCRRGNSNSKEGSAHARQRGQGQGGPWVV